MISDFGFWYVIVPLILGGSGWGIVRLMLGKL
jgi:hypothetical protein